jgi:hypothetical protein
MILILSMKIFHHIEKNLKNVILFIEKLVTPSSKLLELFNSYTGLRRNEEVKLFCFHPHLWNIQYNQESTFDEEYTYQIFKINF